MAVAFKQGGIGGEFGTVERRFSVRDALADGARLPPGVYLALVRRLYATGTWVALGLAAAAIFIGGIAAWRAADPWLAVLVLSAGLLTVGLLPLKRAFRYHCDAIDAAAARTWERRWILVSAGYSLAIGAFAARAFLGSSDSIVHMMALAICLSGAATILSNSVRPLVLVVQLGGKLVLPSLALASTGDPIYVALALAGAALVFNVGQIGLSLYGKTVAELEHNARFETALGNMTHGLVMFGPDHRLLICNRRYIDMFGFSPEIVRPGVSMRELLEHSIAVGNHPASALDELHDLITGAMAQAEVAFLHVARGMTFTVTNRPMADGGWVATFEDITERLAAEARLRESERKLATLVANLPGMAYRCAPEAPWPLLYVSEGAEALTGYAASDFIDGKLTWADVIHPDDVDMVERMIDEAAPGERSFSMSYRIVHRSGDTRWVFEQGQPVLGADGDLIALEGFIGDMTDQVTTETKLRRLQTELLQVSRASAMGAMGAAIAHELNQPLAAAANYAAAVGLMLSRDEAPLARVREACERLNNEVLRAGEIIRRLRSLAASGEAQVDDEDLAELIEDSNVLTLAGARELGVACRFELARPLVVAADRVQIQQVLLNLVRNAVEAMRDAARRELVISTSGQDGEARITVEDSGPGLADEVKANLFAPFTTTKGGMGVGLAICRTIIEAHGGRIWAEAVDGGGTRFCLTLPLASRRNSESHHIEAQVG
jgi:PAS domain S-box-containing protein